ncbi:MAG: glycosyltransferase [Lachnospiraceae bacterium]|nr:glycosyltransferase [Lachnospiraceae bacterium]
MDQIKVSVVIPVYNVERYLGECLDSVLTQSLDAIEVVCVDDGSSDSSAQILRDYAGRDPRVVNIFQENSGQSAARNAGTAAARGEYVLYLDSDDLLLPGALAQLCEKALADDLDILYFDATSFCADESCRSKADIYKDFYQRKHEYPGVWTGSDLMKAMFANNEYIVSPCLQLARREYLTRQGCGFYHGIIHEDNLYTFNAMLHAPRCGYLHATCYSRRVRPESIMTQKVSPRHVKGYFTCYLEMRDLLRRSRYADDQELWDLVYCVLRNTRTEFLQLCEEGGDVDDLTGYEREAFMAEVADWAIALWNQKQPLYKRAARSLRERGLAGSVKKAFEKVSRRPGKKEEKQEQSCP